MPKSNIGSISVFFPAFNDEATIGSMVGEALTVLQSIADDYEVIVINDGSTDRTSAVLNELAHHNPQIKVVHHKTNGGYGAALRSGFRHAKHDFVFYTDGDGQYDVREIERLLPLMTSGVDVVNGYKISRADNQHRKIVGAFYNGLARLLFRLPIRDVDCDFRLMRRSAIQSIELTTSSGVICVEMVRKLHAAGSVFAEAPVHHYPRLHGRSQFFTLRRVVRTGIDFLILWSQLVLQRPSVASINKAKDHDDASTIRGKSSVPTKSRVSFD